MQKSVNIVDLVKRFQSLSMSLFLNLLFEPDSYSNAYFLAKFGFDTAESEPWQVCPIERSTGPFLAQRAAAMERPLSPRLRAANAENALGHRRTGAVPARRSVARSGKLNRARSRLYRGQILQENMRLKALAEIYKMHSFAQLCNLNSLSKFCGKQMQLFPSLAKFLKCFAIFGGPRAQQLFVNNFNKNMQQY